jgi:acetyl esterase/lipase
MSQSVHELTPPAADQRVSYGSGPFHFADLRFPTTKKPWPVIVNIHGGFWRSRYDLKHAGHFCAALAKTGFATCNVEYRRVGNPGGGWPGSLEDIREAFRFATRQGAAVGFDVERIAVVGHSAGGQLALALAAYEPELNRVVSLAGVLDLKRAYELHLSNDAVVGFLQGTPEQLSDTYREASPIDLIVKARQIIIAGSEDDVVPPDFSRDYVERKKPLGEPVELIEIANANHDDVIDPRSQAFPIILQAIQKLLP